LINTTSQEIDCTFCRCCSVARKHKFTYFMKGPIVHFLEWQIFAY